MGDYHAHQGEYVTRKWGDHEEAIHHYRNAEEYERADRLVDGLSDFFHQNDMYADASKILEGTVHRPAPPPPFWAFNHYGMCLYTLGNRPEALQTFKKALKITKDIEDKAGEGTTLNNISQIYDAQGDYNTALQYLQKSLIIRKEIGDKAGLCATLFNMGHIHVQNNEIQEAVSAWVAVYQLAKAMNEAQALEALENLAPRLGMPPGLEGWETLLKKMEG